MDSFQQQAFNFKTPNLDFDPNKIPADGEQYLQKVFHERAKCSTVVVKPIINKSATSVASVWNKYTNVCIFEIKELFISKTNLIFFNFIFF